MTPADPLEIQVVLADDHDLVRSGIGALLSAIAGVKVIAEARDGEELLRILSTLKPHVVVTDINMPKLDGIAATQRISEEYPEVRVIILSMDTSADAVKRAVASGASGYVRKDAPRQELEMAVRGVMTTGSYFGNGVAQLLLQRAEETAVDLLTARQLEVLTLLAQGKSSKQIGFELGLSSKTIDVHRANIMQRLALSDVASLTLYAVRNGLVKV